MPAVLAVQLLRSLFAWFAARPAQRPLRPRPGIEGIDTQRIERELDLQAEARRLGRANVPSPDAGTLSALESNIVQIVDRARQQHLGWARDRLDVLNRTIATVDLEPLALEVFSAAEGYEHRANALLDARAPVLKALAATLQGRKDELTAFKRRNGLTRDAHFPAATLRTLLLVLLGALVLVEGLLNAFFFAQGIDSGILGGWIYAGAFSFVNVCCAYVWGRYFVPYVNHYRRSKRLLGLAAIVLAVLNAIAIALLLGHFRDALSHEAQDAARAALVTLAAAPFGLQTVHSWALFGVTLACALLAAFDAFRLDDPYPHYGQLARRLLQAREDYAEEMADLRAMLAALKDATLDELQRTLDQAAGMLHRLNESIEHKASTEMRLANALRDASNCLDLLLRRFRDENRAARHTPAPAYFGEAPALLPLDWPSFDTGADRHRLEALRDRLGQMRIEATEARAAIMAAFNRRRATAMPLDALFPAEPGEESYEAARA